MWTNCRVKSHQTCKPPGCDVAASRVFGDGQAFFLSPNLCVCDENGDRLFIYIYIYIQTEKIKVNVYLEYWIVLASMHIF